MIKLTKYELAKSKLTEIMSHDYKPKRSHRSDFIEWAQEEMGISKDSASHYYHKISAHSSQEFKNKIVRYAGVRKNNKYVKAVESKLKTQPLKFRGGVVKESPMKWTSQAINAIEPIYQQIVTHPFIQQLASGDLSPAIFSYYMQQDALYLAQYRKILAAIAAKCDNADHQRQFLHFAAATIEAELAVHRHFLSNADTLTQGVPAPNNLLYTGYLYQQLNTQSLPVIIASILPCFYLYQKVGETLITQAQREDHPYQLWLSTYASEEFKQDVQTVMSIADELAQTASPVIQAVMTDAFITASKMEWLFWDGAWQQQSWPV